jgi:hypothetical protein
MTTRVVADRRRDIACVFMLVSACGFWFGLKPGSSSAMSAMGPVWWSILFSSVLGILAVGIWRAAEWARMVSGGISVVLAVRYVVGFVQMVRGTDHVGAGAYAFVVFFALWWGAIGYYLLGPSTKHLFAHVRATRADTGAATS